MKGKELSLLVFCVLFELRWLQLTNDHARHRVPVRLDVFYEALCPYSRNFIVDELWPTYQNQSEIMELHLVPFGIGKVMKSLNGTWAFSCPHGPEECYSNLVQTCGINSYDMPKILPFIVCMENSSEPELSGPECAKDLGIDFEPIERCTRSQEGNIFQYKMAEKALALNVKRVPFPVINNDSSPEIQEKMLDDLRKVVYDIYQMQDAPQTISKYGIHLEAAKISNQSTSTGIRLTAAKETIPVLALVIVSFWKA